ncbi:MAG: type II toxin-antitoxin system PemK/MazF family toxin [Thermoanaerobaculia bacterium]
MRYPERGEVRLVDLGLAAKVRPCVVVSTRIGDLDRALITLVPHTTSTRGTQFESVLPVRFSSQEHLMRRDLSPCLWLEQLAYWGI